jgi:hypothetical protein
MWVKSGSLLTTHPNTGLDVEEPPEVRNYLVSSGPHGSGTPSTSTSPAGSNSQFNSQVDANPLLRALWVALDEWIMAGTPPPPSANASVNAGTATFIPSGGNFSSLGITTVNKSDVGYPEIPTSMDLFSGLVTVRNFWDFGPDYPKGILANIPAKPTGSYYKASVPKVDKYGHEIAGIRLPEIEAPIGTSSGWALRPAAFGGSRTVLMARKELANLSPLQKTMQAKLQEILDLPSLRYTGQKLRS